MEGQKKTTKNLSQDSWSPDQDSGPPRYKKEVVTVITVHDVFTNVSTRNYTKCHVCIVNNK
jgi:hypothetical protein